MTSAVPIAVVTLTNNGNNIWRTVNIDSGVNGVRARRDELRVHVLLAVEDRDHTQHRHRLEHDAERPPFEGSAWRSRGSIFFP